MGQYLPRRDTPLAEPGDHRGFTLALDRILRENLPPDLNTEPVRVRLIAHASWACGWNSRETWWYNYWGVKRGGWTGDYYTASAPELDADGQPYTIPNDAWRAFHSPAESVADTVERLREQPDALAAALNPSPDADAEYVAARKAHGYFTDTLEHTTRAIVSRCKEVRFYLNEGSAGSVSPFLLVALGVIGALLLAVALAAR